MVVRSCYVRTGPCNQVLLDALREALAYFADEEETAAAIPDMMFNYVRFPGHAQAEDVLGNDDGESCYPIQRSEWFGLFRGRYGGLGYLSAALAREIVSCLYHTDFVACLVETDAEFLCSISGQVPL